MKDNEKKEQKEEKQKDSLKAYVYDHVKARVILCLYNKSNKYESESHFVTCAVLKLLKEEGF